MNKNYRILNHFAGSSWSERGGEREVYTATDMAKRC